jgi:hypothetical protein
VTKHSDETFNVQPETNRWYYEIQNLTKLLLAEDYDAIYAGLDTTIATVETMEDARRAAGICFPGDE